MKVFQAESTACRPCQGPQRDSITSLKDVHASERAEDTVCVGVRWGRWVYGWRGELGPGATAPRNHLLAQRELEYREKGLEGKGRETSAQGMGTQEQAAVTEVSGIGGNPQDVYSTSQFLILSLCLHFLELLGNLVQKWVPPCLSLARLTVFQSPHPSQLQLCSVLFLPKEVLCLLLKLLLQATSCLYSLCPQRNEFVVCPHCPQSDTHNLVPMNRVGQNDEVSLPFLGQSRPQFLLASSSLSLSLLLPL